MSNHSRATITLSLLALLVTACNQNDAGGQVTPEMQAQPAPPAQVAAVPPAETAEAAVDYNGSSRWWKGNTHAHTWWSDGDNPPEMVADWYKRNGWQFLVISDHNTFQMGEKWYPVDGEAAERRPQLPGVVDEYVAMFGPGWVELREVEGLREVKLKPLDEFRSLFEVPERFIFIKGEEITDSFGRHPVHINGMNLVEYIEPAHGDGVAQTIQNNLDLVVAQAEQYGQPMLAHLNHPNFHFAQTAEDLFSIDHKPGDGFFEMYNGHSGVRNYGDERHESTERIWDIVLSKRLGEYGRSVLYGVASDDAHVYTTFGVGNVNPGRGWVMVRSDWLTPNKITDAIKRGDFYNSSGVTLRSLDITAGRIDLEIEPENGVSYRVEFVGTLQDADLQGSPFADEEHPHEGNLDHLHQTINRYSDDIGKVLATVEGTTASYEVQGNEIYVRARIVSSKLHPNPYEAGDVEMAWTQPLVVMKNDSQR